MRNPENRQEIVRNVNSLKDIRDIISEIHRKEPLAVISVKMDTQEEKIALI